METREIAHEAHIKAAVLEALRHSPLVGKSPVIANEYVLGRSSIRADLAVMGRNFIGIEVKSERDSLKRLPAQVSAYAKYFDHVIVAVSDRHLKNLDWKQLRSTEIWLVDRFCRIRVASYQCEFVEPACRSGLLTYDQKTRHGLVRNETDIEKVDEIFHKEFISRYEPTSREFWEQVRGRKISKDDIALLSRTRESRARLEVWSEARAAERERWLQKAATLDR